MISQNVYVRFDTFNTRDEVLDFVYDEKELNSNINNWKEDLDKYTLFDLSMVSKLDYYDGIMLKGYFKNLYKEILSGGRYDGLTESFGRRVPAIGFTIYFDALMEAINR